MVVPENNASEQRLLSIDPSPSSSLRDPLQSSNQQIVDLLDTNDVNPLVLRMSESVSQEQLKLRSLAGKPDFHEG